MGRAGQRQGSGQSQGAGQAHRPAGTNARAVLQYEGSVWRALGIMAAAGGLRNAALLLRELRMPDAAAAFCAACKEAGFHSAFAPADAGELQAMLSLGTSD